MNDVAANASRNSRGLAARDQLTRTAAARDRKWGEKKKEETDFRTYQTTPKAP